MCLFVVCMYANNFTMLLILVFYYLMNTSIRWIERPAIVLLILVSMNGRYAPDSTVCLTVYIRERKYRFIVVKM